MVDADADIEGDCEGEGDGDEDFGGGTTTMTTIARTTASSSSHPGAVIGLPKETLRKARGKGPLKGLRHFSLKVCSVLEAKKRTTYNEVSGAD